MSIQDIPSDAKEGLVGDQANGVFLEVFLGMSEFEFEVSGDHAPGIGIDLAIGGTEDAARVSDLVAGFAQGATFEHVIFVIGDDMVEDFLGVSVELPHAQDDMVEFDEMMAFEVCAGAAFQAYGSLVPVDPVRVRQRGSDTLV